MAAVAVFDAGMLLARGEPRGGAEKLAAVYKFCVA